MTVSALHSQDDKVWINRQDALRKLAQADSLAVYKDIVKQKESDVRLLNDRIETLKAIINQLNQLDASNLAAIASYKKQLEENENIKKLMLADYKAIEKRYKKQKRKTFWTGFAGIVGIGASLWLGFH